jgi:pimeloyl-ACP methyl ester carboxylesterase
MLDVGESILSTCSIDGNGVTPPDFWGQDHVEDGWYEMLRAEQVFYTDLDDRAAKEATAALGPHSYLSMNQRLTQAAWHTIPSTFILATEDQAIPLWAQEKWAERGAQRVRRIASSHSPFLAKPAETAALIRAELEDAAR